MNPPRNNKNGSCTFYAQDNGCFHYAKPTGQRPVGLPVENGTTFFDQTGPIKRNGSLIVSRVFYISVIYWGKVGQWTSLSWNGKFRSGRSERSKWTPGRKVPKRSFPLDFRPKLAELLTEWKAHNVNLTLPTKFKKNLLIDFFPVLTKYNLSDTNSLRQSIYFFLKVN